MIDLTASRILYRPKTSTPCFTLVQTSPCCEKWTFRGLSSTSWGECCDGSQAVMVFPGFQTVCRQANLWSAFQCIHTALSKQQNDRASSRMNALNNLVGQMSAQSLYVSLWECERERGEWKHYVWPSMHGLHNFPSYALFCLTGRKYVFNGLSEACVIV